MFNILWIIIDLCKIFKDKFYINNQSLRWIKHSFLFGFILNKLDINANGIILTNNYHYNFALGIFILSLICFLNLINIMAFLVVKNLLNKNNIDIKYSKFKWIINYFSKTSLYFVIFEGFICLLFLFAIVMFSLYEIYLGV